MCENDRLVTLTLCVNLNPYSTFRIGGYLQNAPEIQGSLSVFWFVFTYDIFNNVSLKNGILFFADVQDNMNCRYEVECNSISELSDLIIRHDCLVQSSQTIIKRKEYKDDISYVSLNSSIRDQIEQLFLDIEDALYDTCTNTHPLLK